MTQVTSFGEKREVCSRRSDDVVDITWQNPILHAGAKSSIQSVLETEHELETVLLGVRVPMRPVPVPGIVRFILDFSCGNAKSDGLVRFSGNLQRGQSSKSAIAVQGKSLQLGIDRPCSVVPFSAPRHS